MCCRCRAKAVSPDEPSVKLPPRPLDGPLRPNGASIAVIDDKRDVIDTSTSGPSLPSFSTPTRPWLSRCRRGQTCNLMALVAHSRWRPHLLSLFLGDSLPLEPLSVFTKSMLRQEGRIAVCVSLQHTLDSGCSRMLRLREGYALPTAQRRP